MNTYIPENYRSLLSIYDTQKAIGLLKRLFEDQLAANLSLFRVSAPLFRLQRISPGAGAGDQEPAGRPRHGGDHADGRGEIGLLPDSRAAVVRRRHRFFSADLADEGSGGRADGAGCSRCVHQQHYFPAGSFPPPRGRAGRKNPAALRRAGED